MQPQKVNHLITIAPNLLRSHDLLWASTAGFETLVIAAHVSFAARFNVKHT